MQFHFPSEGLPDVSRLSRVFEDTTATYKFYWFIALVNLTCRYPERFRFSFDEIVAEMMSEAWYPVHYFKLSFGLGDKLEEHILKLRQYLDIPEIAQKSEVVDRILGSSNDPQVRQTVYQMTRYVPYKFLTPWMPGTSKNADVERQSRLSYNWCPYAIYGKEIEVDPVWVEYIRCNAVFLKDFCFWRLTEFLQKRNPNVPDIPSKLVKPIERQSLAKQRQYWDQYLAYSRGMECIYTGEFLTPGQYELDHFIPWSFVVHDLIWNLLPSAPSINASKSNNIPSLDRFLAPMARMQQAALRFHYQRNSSNRLLEDFQSFRQSVQEMSEAPEDRFLVLYKNEFFPLAQTALNMGFLPWTTGRC